MVEDYKSIRVTKLCDGWLEAAWREGNSKIIYRIPDIRLSKIGIVVAHRIDMGHTHATTIRRSGFGDGVSKGAVNRALKQLEHNKYIYKSAKSRGTNSCWRRVAQIGIMGEEMRQCTQ